MSTTTVTSTNVNVYVSQTNAIGGIVGMGPMKPPATVSAAAMQFEKAVLPKVISTWSTDYPNTPLPAGQTDFGYMGPYSALQPGSVPACVQDQVNQDMSNWQLPTGAGAAVAMAKTITQLIYSHGGQAALSKGATPAGPNESIDWLLLSGQVYVTPTELGICYVFAAALSVNI